MKQEATVIEERNNEVIVGCDKSACAGCHGSFFCNQKDTSFSALNPNNIEIRKGEKVEIDMPSRKTLTSIFLSLGLPLILFIPGYFVGTLCSDNEFILLLFGISFMALGFLFSYVYFKRRKKEYMPTITNVISEDRN